MLPRDTTLLFQGDSITDAGRDRADTAPNQPAALGCGYAYLVTCRLLGDAPAAGLRAFNRGISGHRVPDLLERWPRDTLALAPDVLSLLIGVNDLWHKLGGRYDGSVRDFELGYRSLLEGTRRALPRARLLLCEPFVLRCGAVDARWFPEMDERRAVVPRLAREFGASLVPFQSVLDDAVGRGFAPEQLAADGVHPTLAGHQLLADAWLEVLGAAA
jgi:lysophospholipase L1-like esterase